MISIAAQAGFRSGAVSRVGPYSDEGRPPDCRDNIANCNQSVMTRGNTIIQEPGNMSGPTISGIQALIDKDPLAFWDTGCQRVVGWG